MPQAQHSKPDDLSAASTEDEPSVDKSGKKPSRVRRRVATVFIIIGVVLLVGALGLFLYNRYEAQQANDAANEVLAQIEDQTPLYTYPEDGIMPTITIDGYEYIGTLEIPRFGLELPVQNEWSYEGFHIAPGRYSGSVWTNDLVIAAHNYERHFGNLQNLDRGDTVIFTDVLDNVFTYEVAEVSILQPTAVEEMISSNYPLTLFTCTYGGQTRVTVRCNYTSASP